MNKKNHPKRSSVSSIGSSGVPKKKANKKVFIVGGIAAVVMFAFCFAMVPLYSVLCKATGSNTSINGGQLLTAVPEKPDQPADLTREVTVQFIAVKHNGMPWEFYPRTASMKVHPGENNKVLFYIKNTLPQDSVVQAIPSMTPTEALSHFHKIQCFCFTQQPLKAHEAKDMPMVFRIDNDLPKNIHVITLAYTLFDVTPKKM